MENIEVIYEDNHLIVINKHCGEITQGDKTGDEPIPEKVKRWLANKYNKQGNVFAGVIHRLDRPTSGLVILAKTSKALGRMNKMFKERDVQKTYWAIVENKPRNETGILTDYLAKNEKQNKSYVSNTSNVKAKKAELTYKLLASSQHYHLLEIKPKTGRHHQIRVQLSNIDCIIKGDVKYGARRPNEDRGISLHAREVSFIHPVSKEPINITAAAPKDTLWQWFEGHIENNLDISK